MKKSMWIALIAIVMVAVMEDTSLSDNYRYITAEALNLRLNDDPSSLLLIDLSPEALYSLRHIPGSLPTGAYPLQTADQLSRLNAVLPRIKAAAKDIVLICPRGGRTALRAVQHLKSKGVDPARLLILEKGILGWPYATQKSTTSESSP